MHSKYSVRAVSVLVFLPLLLPVVLTGQRAQEVVIPLKNWAAPLYWQPKESEIAERETAVGVTPKISFSTNQVSTAALTFVAISPCRLVDTRGVAADFNGISPFSGPSLGPSTTTTFPVQSAAEATADTTPTPCGTIPSIAQAYSFNITAIPKTAGGIAFVTVWPAGSPQPGVSTINDGQGAILANAAIVPAGTPSGGVNVLNSGPATMDLTIDMNGFYAAPTDLNGNTAVGSGALMSNGAGTNNTATGQAALGINTGGNGNTADGSQALSGNTSGNYNTASGQDALLHNSTGASNTASGALALLLNTTGNYNTATGYQALESNSTGTENTASGTETLSSNTTGSDNTASGALALGINSTGSDNTAIGYQALYSNNGVNNTASGWEALNSNTTGTNNTASGALALGNNTTGSDNIAIGFLAGANNPVGSGFNIDIGSTGGASDSGAIRIGDTQTSFIAAGIYGVNLGGSAVSITSSGQLSSPSSSRRYKEDIHDMSDASRSLMDLRPVTFRYRKAAEDGSKPLQYGLIAEEVAEVYPDLVVFKNGQPDAVQYQMLPAMLLNEVQRQQAEIRRLEDRLAKLEAILSSTPAAPAVPGVR